MNRPKRTLLIDGDVALYQCSTAVEEVFHWGGDIWSLVSDVKEAKQRLDIWLADLKERLEADSAIFTVSGTKNWRKDVLPTYKLHRKKHRKPVAFHPLKEYMEETYRTYSFDNLEGDDVLGLLAGGYKRIKGQKVVVTIDKDLLTIPGYHYNPMKDSDGIVEVTEKEADYNHLFQALMGDKVDGYNGCPGIGPKSAARLLSTPTWDVVVQAYEKAGLSEEDALVQARVARILRHGEYNVSKNEVKLWKPKETENE